MTRTVIVWSVLPVLPLVGLVACEGTESYDVPTPEQYDELAEATARTLENESGGDALTIEVAASVAVEGDLPFGFSGDPGSFDGTFLGVTYGFALTCVDGQGSDRPDCGPGTDGAEAEVSWTGDLDTRRYDAAFRRDGAWSLTGLSTLDPVFDGQSSFVVDTSFSGVWLDTESSYHLEYDAVYDQVALDPLIWLPVSGQITYDLYADRFAQTGDDTLENRFLVAVDIEFVGPALAIIKLDGEHAYDLDLDSGEVTPQ